MSYGSRHFDIVLTCPLGNVVMKGYLKNEKATKNDFRVRVLHSRDAVE
jgi:hypothetical protein